MTSGRNRRRAPLPTGGYRRPPSVDATGLVVTVFGENGGVEGVFDFSRLPGQAALRRSIAAAFAAKSGPGGPWRVVDTCRSGFYGVCEFLRYCAGLAEPPGGPQDITVAFWAAWKLSLPASPAGLRSLFKMRLLLGLVEGVPAETVAAAGCRIGFGARPAKQSSYSMGDFEHVRSAAASTFHAALVRIRRNREVLRRWYAGEFTAGTQEYVLGQALDSILCTGDVPFLGTRPQPRRVDPRYTAALGGTGPEHRWGRLFLTLPEMGALCVLLVASESWNRSVLGRMRIPGHDPAVAEDFAIHTVEVDKRRRPVHLRHTSNNLVDTGAGSPGRLMGQAIEATELAREHLALAGRPTKLLLVSRRANHVGEYFVLGPAPQFALTCWVAAANERGAGLVAADGSALKVTLRRLRRTVQVLIRKEPAQNTQQTHDSVYVLPDAQFLNEAQDTIAQGLTNALDHARTVVEIKVVLGEDADILTELADSPALAKAVIAGRRNTATAACLDFHGGPTGEPGPCTASFLMCLACKNAIVTRQHLPGLTYLHQCVESLRGTLPTSVWDKVWRSHFQRLDSLLKQHTTPVERAQILRGATGAERDLIDRMLHRGLDA